MTLTTEINGAPRNYGKPFGDAISKSDYTPILTNMINTQVEDATRWPAKPGDLIEPKNLLGWYFNTNRFKDMHLEAKTHIKLGALSREDLRDRMAGRIFQDLTFLYSFSTTPDICQILLSPEKTHKLYGDIFHNEDIINAMGLDSIDGISVPDGVVVGNYKSLPKIIAVREYTSRRSYDFQKKEDAFEMDQRKHPDLFLDTPKLIFTFLKNTPLESMKINPAYSILTTVPFDAKIFRAMIDAIFEVSWDNNKSLNQLISEKRIT